jgi:hypothetical protein
MFKDTLLFIHGQHAVQWVDDAALKDVDILSQCFVDIHDGLPAG